MVGGQRNVSELNGEACLNFELVAPPQKGIRVAVVRQATHRSGSDSAGAAAVRRAGREEVAVPTAYTPDVIDAPWAILEKIYRAGYVYQKCGIMLTDLVPA